MSAIKRFFDQKKADAKFKLAGKGKRLGDAEAAAQESASRAATATSSVDSDKPRRAQGNVERLSSEQRRAAEAALTRIIQRPDQEDFDKKRSKAAIRAQARKELEQEKKAVEEAERLKSMYAAKKAIDVEGSSLLAVTGVFYRCPLIDESLCLPREEMKKRIREFLYDKLDEEPGLTAALIIHTFNNDPEKVSLGVTTLCKYLDNILQNPADEKFRKIRKSNKAYQERVACLEGHDLFMSAAGFETITEQEQSFWVFPQQLIEDHFEHLQELKDALISAEPIQANLDRGTRVLVASEASKQPELPPDFFNLTAEDIKREQQSRTEEVELESMLRTKAMREKEQHRMRKRFRFCLIRVRFPDGLVLQGTFSVHEKLQQVLEFVSDNLSQPLPFIIISVGTRFTEEDAHSSLLELGLVPASLLTFAWHPDMAEEINAQLGPNHAYLKEELVAMASTSSTR